MAAERDFYINFSRQECIFHPDEEFACVKSLGPLTEEEARGKAEILREILPEISEKIELKRNGNSSENIPQMCRDCKFRLIKEGKQK